MAENLVRLYEAEGQYGLIGNAYLLAALTHSAAGHAAKAIEFAKLAVEAKLLSDGPDSEDIKSMESLVKAPKSHWSWNARKGIKEHDHDHHH